MARLPGPAPGLYPTPASEFQWKEYLFLKSAKNLQIEFKWPVGSCTLEAMPVGGRMDGVFHLSHTHAPGSTGCSQHSTTWAGMSLPRGAVISVFFRERNDPEPNSSCSNLTKTIFSLF